MSKIGTTEHPLRVAIVGAGPTGFYAADYLLKQKELTIEVDMFDRLPTPFGLVRGGVAPDHQKIKSVTKAYDRIAAKPNMRFYGNVEFGKDVFLADLKKYYHQVIFTTGAQTDRAMNIPGIDLKNSHAATEFVAWYNGHPDYRDLEFDLSQERVAVIGIGNVAMDVARILCRSEAELHATDIADHALKALANSNVKEVYVLGRRGPGQAKFTNPEIKEVGHMEEANVFTVADEAELDELSKQHLADNPDRATEKKIKIIQEYAAHQPADKPKKMVIRFLVSPTELYDDGEGRVGRMKLVKNQLYATGNGSLRPKATEQTEELEVGLVFRSIGYRGVPLPDVPFRDDWGIILNDHGRILDPETKDALPGMYTGGWIKRGPSGVIGTNKPDAVETVKLMLEDLANGIAFTPEHPAVESAKAMINEKQPNYFSYADWQQLNELEIERGKAQGRPRVKFTRIKKMVEAVKG